MQNKILKQNLSFKPKIICLRVNYKKKDEEKNFFATLKSLTKGVGSGYVIQRYGSGSAPKCQGSSTLLVLARREWSKCQQL
jgi:hypothetical protein